MKLYLSYLKLHLKIAMEYKSSFFMTIIAQVFYIFAELIGILSVIGKFQLFDMYNINEVLFNFSILWLGYALMEMLCRGFDMFSRLIVRGDFDILLTRPRSIFVQVLGSQIAYEKIGRVLVVLVLFIYSIIHLITYWSFMKVLLLINVFIAVCIIYLSIFIIGAAFTFITVEGIEAINIFSAGSRQVGQYPMKIYNKYIILFFTFVIPITLVNYYPIEYLCDRTTNILYVFMPLLTIILFLISLLLFRLGLNKYTSTGS